jgi:GR25 family glycosyltransferase involved in LPS biosynthesis
MSFNTYVINLKNDIEKWNRIKKDLNKIYINPIRFEAINGNDITAYDDTEVTLLCNNFCPNSVKGCGLSHINVAKKFLKEDKNDYCLILEDDAVPKVYNLKNIIPKISRKYKNWDIIKLHCIFDCNINKVNPLSKIFSGSNVAFLLSRKGAKKISNEKVNWHIDIQFNMKENLNIYIHKPYLFTTYYNNSSNVTNKMNIDFLNNNKIMNIPLSYLLNVKILKIPYIEYNINPLNLFYLIIIIILIKYYT